MESKGLLDRLANGTMTRREALKYLGAAGLGLAMVPVMGRKARAATVSYFTFDGYNIPEMFQSYVDAHGMPDTPVYADAEEAFQRPRAGFVADVIHPCSGDTPRWRDAGLIQAIDTSKLSNFGDLAPGLVNLKGTQYDGEQWFMPWEWGQTSVTYRTDLVDLGGMEESWGILWDKKYAGKVAMIDAAEDAWWCAAIYAGVDVNNVTDDDLELVRKLLEQQRPLLRYYSSDMTTIEQGLASGELVAAMTWNSSPLELKKQGLDVAFADVKEGALTWVCGLTIHPAAKDAGNWEKAHELIDAYLAKESMYYELTQWGYGVANSLVYQMEGVTEEYLNSIGLTADVDGYLADGVFSTYQAHFSEIVTRYEELLAGF